MKKSNGVPSFDAMINPLFKALKQLGGSGTIDEIYEKVVEIMKLPENVLEMVQSENDNRTKVSYRLAWARTYLKKYGAIDNSSRGVWAINGDYLSFDKFNEKEVVKSVRVKNLKDNEENIDVLDDNIENDGVESPEELEPWRKQLKNLLLSMEPSAFERLTQRLLRESGFIQVEITGRTGDGGVDGKGILRLNGILSFHIIFQCKKYKGSVTSSQMRDFRGAMQGRAEKGLFITTGIFTRDAIKEASRDGAPPIDLIDGEQLIDKLVELGMGVNEVIKRDYEVNQEYFTRI